MSASIKIFTAVTFYMCIVCAQGQFAPAAGQPGSTAIFKDSSIIVNWATGCEIVKGYLQINLPDSGFVSVGSAVSAIGKAGENGVVSLGDGGIATLTFSSPIINGAGADFCVFENSFLDTFLELAFVEVSSDGVYFVRFPAISYTQDTLQTDGFGYTQPEHIHNLAGKYRGLYGTPFDLDDLKDSVSININNITHVRVIDVVGSIDSIYATYDVLGNKVNDPFPTPFPSGGFDLDAVGVIHQSPLSSPNIHQTDVLIFPNPFTNTLSISGHIIQSISITNSIGQKIFSELYPTLPCTIQSNDWPLGTYHIQLLIDNAISTFTIVKQ